jgi:hypothetical protein
MSIQISNFTLLSRLLTSLQLHGFSAFIRAGDGIPDKGDLIFPVIDCGDFIIQPKDVNMVSVQTAEHCREHYGDVRLYIEAEKLSIPDPVATLLDAPGFRALPYVSQWLECLVVEYK